MAVRRGAKRSRKVTYASPSDDDEVSLSSSSDSYDTDEARAGTQHRPGKEKVSVGKGNEVSSNRKKRGEVENQHTLERQFLPDLNQTWSPLQAQSGDHVPDYDSDFDVLYVSESDSYIDQSQNWRRHWKKKRASKTKNGRAGNKKRKDQNRPKLQWESWAEQNEKWIDEFEGNNHDRSAPNPKAMEPSPAVLLPLLRFQKEWLSWALSQEASQAKGGILADEMGMGKTIQAISLVLTARDLRVELDTGTSISADNNKSTLVVCPVVAVIQWAGEIEKHTEKGKVRVLVYHGAKRDKCEVDFRQYDFVLTTYSTIESDYRKYILPPKEKCEYCGRGFVSTNKLYTHQRYYCGPDARKTEKQAKQETKKNKGLSKAAKKLKLELSGSECESDENEKEGRKNVKKINKKKKAMDDNFGEDSAGTSSSRGKSLLHSVKWERIILDEAHFIKDRRCNTARAIFALKAEYKWALSGTPLQNRVGELYSLVRFLEIYPYSYYLCKDCNCRLQDFSSSKVCTDCEHSSVRHFCWWNKHIAKPIQVGSSQKAGQRAMTLLREKVLKSIVLRRTKKGRAADIALPPKIVTLRRDSMDEQEHEFYEALYTQSRTQFDSYVDAGTLMNNYAHIFDLLTRLRQAVDHPYLVLYSSTAQPAEGHQDNSASKTVCGLCNFEAEDVVVTSCEHSFCKSCLIDYGSSLGSPSCPTCSTPLTVDLTTKNSGDKSQKASKVKGFRGSSILNRINLSNFKTSTKIEALKEEIRNMVEHDGSAKGIVFSQFTSFLDLIHFSLRQSGIKCVQLVGSMSLSEREKAINTFTEDSDCRIFLMSLKAGGVALNLTVASHVFLMDPWWNPAVEKQAQDRIHRIGQYKPIRSTRFVIQNTVEERILKLQEKKELVFEGTVGESAEAMAKLTEADLRFLFHT
ncbi:hypothetical protein LUZ61_009038 [Rhynchospora tenuis]|uniref:DNA repair protein RAD16 n=1 Tax=Rhynchospora tenuis TaxID=198213 RepID=A0AAD5ZWN2_9POAL|nr:hypothetical protein LUZ61_009038 [Rhynchospora tenuis]